MLDSSLCWIAAYAEKRLNSDKTLNSYALSKEVVV